MPKIMKMCLNLSKMCRKYRRLFSGHGVYCTYDMYIWDLLFAGQIFKGATCTELILWLLL